MSPFRSTRKVKRTRRGTFELSFDDDERTLLATLPGQLRELLAAPDDPILRRLNPPAYVGDPDREREYRDLMGDDLLQSRLEALEVLESTATADEVDEEQLVGWLRAVNDLRLVLGTRLDVSEDDDPMLLPPDDPSLPLWALYQYLGLLQEQVIEALSDAL